MSGGKNTGTVPKTKHNTRARRENSVNHIPNNLEWHPEYRPRRVRKESNNYAFHLPEAGEDFPYEPTWSSSLGPSNRTDDDELRWSKSSNITPDRGGIETIPGTTRIKLRPDNHVVDDRLVPESIKAHMARGGFKVKMEQSEKKIEELQHQQAALMSLRHKAIQQVKPVQMEEVHQPPVTLRRKAIQQVKPVQMESEKIAKLNERMDDHMMHILQAMENDIKTPTDQHVRNKLNELIAKKAQCDKLLSCLESEAVPEGPASPSSEEADNGRNDFHENEVTLGAVGGEAEEHHQNIENRQWNGVGNSRGEAEKQDNREFDNMAAISAFIENKEMKLEEVMSKFEQLQTLMGHMEKLRDLKLIQRSTMHSDGVQHNAASQPEQLQPQGKNVQNSADKLHTKKVEGIDGRQLNSYLGSTQSTEGYHNMFDSSSEAWAGPIWNGPAQTGNSIESSSDDGEVEYDESPVKLCSTLRQPQTFPKFRRGTQPNTPHNLPTSYKPSTSPAHSQHQASSDPRVRQRVQPQDESPTCPNNSSLAYQVNQLQMQMDQMYSMCQSMTEKYVPNFNAAHPWIPPPMPHPSYLQYYNGSTNSQWHQHQGLVNSLNQCCQLIWHQQKELSALRQALAMLQDESNVFKCGGYGNNLNFESGLLWPQTSPQTLNNQVPPGNRANNYWDNFRSYSRQNLLSGRNKSNEGSIADSSTVLQPPPPPAPQQPSQSSAQPDSNNLPIRKENTTDNTLPHNHVRGQPSPSATWNSGRRPQRSLHTNSTPNADSSSVFSLEQSIYSELETVMSERNPSALLQLLSHLKILRASQCPFDTVQNQRLDGCDLIDQNIPYMNSSQQSSTHQQSHQPHPQNQNLEEKYNQYCQQDDSMSKMLGEISKIIESKETNICTPDFLQQVVNFLTERLNPQVVPKLEASLLKFQGCSLDQVGHMLLCDIASIIWSYVSNQPKQQESIVQAIPEPEIEEGAVGGAISTPQHHQNNSQQSVDTELAEADQPQHNSNSSNNADGFWEKDDSDVLEIENLELSLLEENERSFLALDKDHN